MIKYIKILFIGLFVNIIFSQFQIVEYSFNENNIVTFYINSFDLVTGATNVELFHYGIRADNPSIYDPDIELFLEFSMIVKSSIIGYNTPTEILGGQVRITNISEEVHFKNTDLNINTTRVGNAVFAVDITQQPENEKIEQIANAILQLGKLPNGEYNINVTLKNNNGEILSNLDKEIEIYYPVFLELTNPGGGSLADTTESAIFTTYPVFQWESDYCPSCVYGIRVSEYNPILHSSFSEAITDVSNIPISQADDFFDIGNSTTFQYPASGTIDLQEGKLYVWQVRRNFHTTMGKISSFSNIFLLKIKSAAASAEVMSSMSGTLGELIGETNYDQFFGPGGALENFSLSGNSVIVNNESVSISKLNDFVSQISQGQISVTSVEVE